MTADEFKQRHRALYLSRARLALLIAVNPMTIYRWEVGDAPVPAYAVEKLEEIERTRWPKKLA